MHLYMHQSLQELDGDEDEELPLPSSTASHVHCPVQVWLLVLGSLSDSLLLVLGSLADSLLLLDEGQSQQPAS